MSMSVENIENLSFLESKFSHESAGSDLLVTNNLKRNLVKSGISATYNLYFN